MSAISNALDAMAVGGKRVKVHDEMIPIKHPKPVRELVKRVAEDRGMTEAAVWREAMGEYLTRRGYNR